MNAYLKELENMINTIKKANPDCDDLTLINSVPFLYPFSERLSHFIAAHGYTGAMEGEQGISEKKKFILDLYKSIDSSDLKNTVNSWFQNTHTPIDSEISRKNMYKLCFALHLTVEEVKIFFQTVYLQRAFYCRELLEAVYYYSFLHKYHYNQAMVLYEKVRQALSNTPAQEVPSSYTISIKTTLEKFHTEEEFIAYLIDNQKNFLHYNSSNKNKEAISNNQIARYHIRDLIHELCETQEGEKLSQIINKKITFSNPNINSKDYGYAIQEYCIYNDPLEFFWGKTKKPASSISLLMCIISGIDCIEERKQNPDFSIAKKSQLYKSIRCNFPSKWTLSNILNEKPSSVSDDKVRKALILLKFYTFWAKEKIKKAKDQEKKTKKEDCCSNSDAKPLSQKNLFETFVDELNNLLFDCGFDYLYCKNPYDFLFLYASYSEKNEPLDNLRGIIFDSIEENNNDELL